jgi:hypothetical protein
MTRARMAVLAAVLTLTAACGSSGPSDTPPPLGRYHVVVDIPGEGVEGAMVLTYASADSIAGHWELPDYDAEMKLGFFNVDAWVIAAQLTRFAGLITLRVERSDDGLRCQLARFNDGQRSLGGSCTTDYQGQ